MTLEDQLKQVYRNVRAGWLARYAEAPNKDTFMIEALGPIRRVEMQMALIGDPVEPFCG